jgi:hypothetical protein
VNHAESFSSVSYGAILHPWAVAPRPRVFREVLGIHVLSHRLKRCGHDVTAFLAIGGVLTDPTGGSLIVVSAVIAAPPVRRWASEEGVTISRWAAVALSTGALLAGLWIIGG